MNPELDTQEAVVPLEDKTVLFAPIPSLVALFVPLPIIKSPVVVIGDRALNAAEAVVWPVPPLPMANVADKPAAVPVVFWLNVGHVNEPVLKSPDAGVPKAPPFTTKAPAELVFTANAVATPVPKPVIDPTAGVMVVLVADVIWPWALTAMAGVVVAEP